jgi:hypothetical protein
MRDGNRVLCIPKKLLWVFYQACWQSRSQIGRNLLLKFPVSDSYLDRYVYRSHNMFSMLRNFLVISGLAHCLVHVYCRPSVQQEKLHVLSCRWLEDISVFLCCLFLLFSWSKLQKYPLNTTEMCRRSYERCGRLVWVIKWMSFHVIRMMV